MHLFANNHTLPNELIGDDGYQDNMSLFISDRNTGGLSTARRATSFWVIMSTGLSGFLIFRRPGSREFLRRDPVAYRELENADLFHGFLEV